MLLHSRVNKFFLYALIALGISACGSKAKTEEVKDKADKKDPVTIIEIPKGKDSVKATEPNKRESGATVVQKNQQKSKSTPTVIVERPKEFVKEDVKPEVNASVTDVPPSKEKPVDTSTARVVESTPAPKPDSTTAKKLEEKPKGKPYYFKVVKKEDGKEITGSLQLLEAVGATQYQLVKSGEIVYLEPPKNRRGSYNVVALLPGYRQSSVVFIYNNPPIQKGPHNEEIITLSLDKAKAGDYIDFNNVRFFLNTSLMRPVSKVELDELAILLKENLTYKIKIYGYCNGTHDREAYTKGSSSEFFALDPKGNKKETISSKRLSLARAETVKAYLVQQGIEAARITTKGEGGKVPLYPEGGTLGQYNDRVEVEFVRN